jgi:hypothetical protein
VWSELLLTTEVMIAEVSKDGRDHRHFLNLQQEVIGQG